MHTGTLAALSPSRVRDTALFAGGLALGVVLHVADPSQASFPVCPFYALTGLYCPGCGTLRCLHALLHADLRSALDHNVLTVLFVPLLVVAWLSAGRAGIGGRHPPRAWSPPRWVGRASATAFALFWILRNIPVEPFSWLAP